MERLLPSRTGLWLGMGSLVLLFLLFFFFGREEVDHPYYRLGGITLAWQFALFPFYLSLFPTHSRDALWGFFVLFFAGTAFLVSLQPLEWRVVLAIEGVFFLWSVFFFSLSYCFPFTFLLVFLLLYFPFGMADWLLHFLSPKVAVSWLFYFNPFPLFLYHWAQWDFFRLSWMYDFSHLSDYPYQYPSLGEVAFFYSLSCLSVWMVLGGKKWIWSALTSSTAPR